MTRKPYRLMFLLFVSFTFIVISSVNAQNKVVVIPLMVESPTGPLSPVPKTGQTTSYRDGDDGTHQAGIVTPSPRFVDYGNGTVTDKLTGLIWLKEGNCIKFGTIDGSIQNRRPWSQAVGSCNILGNGYCDLNDGSKSDDWRLPNLKELQSLVDLGQYDPALLPNSPLLDSNHEYWSATTYVSSTIDSAWCVNFYSGRDFRGQKTAEFYVRCVRDGQ